MTILSSSCASVPHRKLEKEKRRERLATDYTHTIVVEGNEEIRGLCLDHLSSSPRLPRVLLSFLIFTKMSEPPIFSVAKLVASDFESLCQIEVACIQSSRG